MSSKSYKKLYSFLIVTSVASFAAIVAMVKTSTLLAKFNDPIWSWMVARREPLYTNVLEYVTLASGSKGLIALSLIFSIAILLIKKNIWYPIILATSMIFAVAISTLLKFILKQPRPDISEMLIGEDTSYSLPSGHTLGASVFLLTLGILFLHDKNNYLKTLYTFLGICIVILVAISRIYLGYHWLTDVLASICLSLIFIPLVMYLRNKFILAYAKPRRARSRKQNTKPMMALEK